MIDRSRTPDDRQWNDLLDEIEWNVSQLRKHGPEAMQRTRSGLSAGPDGYPRSSLPESSIASGRGGDPTGQTVVTLAGGKVVELGDREDSSDTWRGVRDEVAAAVRNMQAKANDAVVRLREALGSMHKALPEVEGERSREVCQSCGVAKQIATKYGSRPGGWVVATAKCESCDRRARRGVST